MAMTTRVQFSDWQPDPEETVAALLLWTAQTVTLLEAPRHRERQQTRIKQPEACLLRISGPQCPPGGLIRRGELSTQPTVPTPVNRSPACGCRCHTQATGTVRSAETMQSRKLRGRITVRASAMRAPPVLSSWTMQFSATRSFSRTFPSFQTCWRD